MTKTIVFSEKYFLINSDWLRISNAAFKSVAGALMVGTYPTASSMT